MALEIGGRLFGDVEQGLALLLALAVLRRVAGDLHARLLGQLLHRLGEGQALGVHDEVEGAAVGFAAEAVIEALVFVDGEGRGLFLVERAQAQMLAALFDQLDVAADDVGEPGAGAKFFQELIGEGHRRTKKCKKNDRTSTAFIRRAESAYYTKLQGPAFGVDN